MDQLMMALGAFFLVEGTLMAAIGIPYANLDSPHDASILIDFAIIFAALGAAVLAWGVGSASKTTS
jgi:hypothetical protein